MLGLHPVRCAVFPTLIYEDQMKYVLVYRERPNGYNWSVMNPNGEYAAWRGSSTGKLHIRSWTSAEQANEYVDTRLPSDGQLLWAPWPADKHDDRADAVAAGWASMGSVTGRFSSSKPAVEEIQRGATASDMQFYASLCKNAAQPLVWPVLPVVDDGSNEEASTVPDALVAELSKRHFIIIIRR